MDSWEGAVMTGVPPVNRKHVIRALRTYKYTLRLETRRCQVLVGENATMISPFHGP